MKPTIFQVGYVDALSFMKVAQGTAIIPYEGYEWLPPGATTPRTDVRQGSEAAAYARKKGIGGKKPGLLGKMWGKYMKLPRKARIGVGLGAAGLLAGGGALLGRSKKHPESKYVEQNMRPELQAQAYGEGYLRPGSTEIPPGVMGQVRRQGLLA